jgi:hypothetical protein
MHQKISFSVYLLQIKVVSNFKTGVDLNSCIQFINVLNFNWLPGNIENSLPL